MPEDQGEAPRLFCIEATAKVRLMVGVRTPNPSEAREAALDAARRDWAEWDVESVLVDSFEAKEIDPETGGEVVWPPPDGP